MKKKKLRLISDPEEASRAISDMLSEEQQQNETIPDESLRKQREFWAHTKKKQKRENAEPTEPTV